MPKLTLRIDFDADRAIGPGKERLDKFYGDHCRGNRLDNTLVNKVRGIVVTLGQIFPSNNPHLNMTYALSLYWLFSRIDQSYDVPPTGFPKKPYAFASGEINML